MVALILATSICVNLVYNIHIQDTTLSGGNPVIHGTSVFTVFKCSLYPPATYDVHRTIVKLLND